MGDRVARLVACAWTSRCGSRDRGRSGRRWCRSRRPDAPRRARVYSRVISRAFIMRLERLEGRLGPRHERAGRRCPCRAGARSAARARARAAAAPASVTPRGPAPDASRARPACRPPAGAGPRRRSANVAAAGSGRAAPASSRRPRSSPSAMRWFFGRAAPSTVTAPASISPLRRRARGEGAAGARNASSRSPASSGAGGQLDAVPSRPPLHHPQEQHDPHDDAGVGDVEGGPRHGVDEVDHGALACAVDQVAERAAEQQPDRQPQPAACRGWPRSSRSGARATARSGSPRSGRRPRARRTRRRCCACSSGRARRTRSRCRPRSMPESHELLRRLVDRDDQPAVASAAAGPARLTRRGSGWRPRPARR